MATEKPRRLGRGLSSLIQAPVPVVVPGPAPKPAAAPPAAVAPAQHVAPSADVSAQGGGGGGPSGGVASEGVAGGRSGGSSQAEPDRSGPEVPGRGGVVGVGAVGAGTGVDGLALAERVVLVPVDEIAVSPYQPRRNFDPVALQTLADSIKQSGMMQPVLLRRRLGRGIKEKYELVAGERRWRAAMDVNIEEIPAIIRVLSDVDAAQWALVENIQREDLNPMERAFAFRALSDRFGLTHAEIAEKVQVDRSAVTWHIRLTELEPEVMEMVSDGRLSLGHAKVLVAATAAGVGEARVNLAKECSRFQWSVRRLEKAVRGIQAAQTSGPATKEDAKRAAVVRDLEMRLGKHLGAQVDINMGPKTGKSGTIAIKFYDLDHFEGLMRKMGFEGGGSSE
jgi:ParB family transcriptional regulator, chromosome partitioning protein